MLSIINWSFYVLKEYRSDKIGLILSGGGARAAALRAPAEVPEMISKGLAVSLGRIDAMPRKTPT